jgi:hypothetical protein
MSVTLSSISITTDEYAVLGVSDIHFTSVVLYWKNTSTSSATFQVVMGDSRTVVLSNVTLDGKASTTQTVRGLATGTAYKFYLQRSEFGSYVDQTSEQSGSAYALVNTLSASMSIAVASSSAAIQWPFSYTGASYSVLYASTSRGSTMTIENADISLASAVHKASLSSLGQNTSYTVSLVANETQMDGSDSVILDKKSFTTSDSVQMSISAIYASYANLAWSGDGTTTYRVIDDSQKVFIAPTTNSMGSVTGLVPGMTYSFELQALQLDGTYSNQSAATVVARSTALTVAGIGSKSASLQWSSLYENAKYSVKYSSDGSTWKDYASTSLLDRTAVITGLTPGTSYTIVLSVIENGTSVAVASSALGGSAPSSSTNWEVIGIIVAVVLLCGAGGLYLVKSKKKV